MTGLGGLSNSLLSVCTKATSLKSFSVGSEIIQKFLSAEDSLVIMNYSIIIKK